MRGSASDSLEPHHLKTPSKRTGVCSALNIPQKSSTCYFSAAMLLVAKIRFIYQKLPLSLKTFVNKSVRAKDDCPAPPAELARVYDSVFKRTLYTANGLQKGGSPIALLESCLIASDISYHHVYVEVVDNDWDALGETWKHFTKLPSPPKDLLAFRVNFRPTAHSNVSKMLQNIPSIASALVHVQTDLSGTLQSALLGGIFRCISSKEGAISHHSIAFTYCKGEVILCNWGSCHPEEVVPKLRKKGYRVLRMLLLFKGDKKGSLKY